MEIVAIIQACHPWCPEGWERERNGVICGIQGDEMTALIVVIGAICVYVPLVAVFIKFLDRVTKK